MTIVGLIELDRLAFPPDFRGPVTVALARLREPVFFAFLSCFSRTVLVFSPLLVSRVSPSIGIIPELFFFAFLSRSSPTVPFISRFSLRSFAFFPPPPSPTFWSFVDIPGFSYDFRFHSKHDFSMIYVIWCSLNV